MNKGVEVLMNSNRATAKGRAIASTLWTNFLGGILVLDVPLSLKLLINTSWAAASEHIPLTEPVIVPHAFGRAGIGS